METRLVVDWGREVKCVYQKGGRAVFIRIVLVIFIVFVLAGCATGSKRKLAQPPQTPVVVQESYLRDYGDSDAWTSKNYEKPIKKASFEPAIQLSLKQIQRALKSAGFYQGPIDGKIGVKTKKAIVKFQKAKGLKADGFVGARTSRALNKYLSQ